MIGADVLIGAADTLARLGAGDAAASELRAAWPALRFVCCAEDDVPARLRPVREAEHWALYLIGGGEHCLALTTDPASAIGLVLAWRSHAA